MEFIAMTGEATLLRVRMSEEGWQSQDRLSRVGWGDGVFGYRIWFSRWDWHGTRVDYLAATYHSGTSDLTKIDEVVCRAANRARRALLDFPDYPPSQGLNGELIMQRRPG